MVLAVVPLGGSAGPARRGPRAERVRPPGLAGARRRGVATRRGRPGRGDPATRPLRRRRPRRGARPGRRGTGGRPRVRVAVTGASGFVGGVVVGRLLAAGHDVVALSRRPVPERPGTRAPAVGPRDRRPADPRPSTPSCTPRPTSTSGPPWSEHAPSRCEAPGGARHVAHGARGARLVGKRLSVEGRPAGPGSSPRTTRRRAARSRPTAGPRSPRSRSSSPAATPSCSDRTPSTAPGTRPCCPVWTAPVAGAASSAPADGARGPPHRRATGGSRRRQRARDRLRHQHSQCGRRSRSRCADRRGSRGGQRMARATALHRSAARMGGGARPGGHRPPPEVAHPAAAHGIRRLPPRGEPRLRDDAAAPASRPARHRPT